MKQTLIAWLLVMLPSAMVAQEMKNHNLEVGKNLDIFNTVYRNLDLFYVDTLNPEKTITAAINGMVRSMDPYTE